MQEDLKYYSTKELVEELQTREGVDSEYVEYDETTNFDINGSAIVIIVED